MIPRRGGRSGRVGAALALLVLANAVVLPAASAQTSAPAPYEGPKARLAVLRFEVHPPTAAAAVGDGVAEMLAEALARTNRYAIGGRAPAELVVLGSVAELAPPTGAPGIGAQVALELRLLDAKTSRVLNASVARARAGEGGAPAPTDGGRLGSGLAPYAGTPVEKALRQALQNGVRAIVASTPAEYLRHNDPVPRPVVAADPGPLPPLTVSQAEPARPPAPPAPVPAPASPPAGAKPAAPAAPPATVIGMRFVKTPTANLRDGSGTSGKIIQSVRRGTRLEVLETRGGWHHVRLPDGKQGWMADSVTSPTPP
jgi:curli biogenesis system outer membrane secretion channel CsgG